MGMTRREVPESSEVMHRLREEMGALRRITGSQRLDRLVAVRSGVAIGVAAVAVLGKVIENGPMVQTLESEGFVERAADPDDGRASVVTATSTGRVAHRRIEATNDELMSEQLVDWSHAELVALVEQLDRLVADLRAVPESRRRTEAG
jgi:hypothetical protein